MYIKEREKNTTNGLLHEMSKQYIKKDKEDNTDDGNRFSKANKTKPNQTKTKQNKMKKQIKIIFIWLPKPCLN